MPAYALTYMRSLLLQAAHQMNASWTRAVRRFTGNNDSPVALLAHAKGLNNCTGDQHFKVWRALLQPDSRHSEQSKEQLLSSLQALRRQPGHWAVILSRGGHFAATLLNVHVKPGKGQGKHETPPFEVVMHKTFHKYVVR